MKVLITSGGTKIKIDLVRSITNMSRGTFGAKICDAFWRELVLKADPEDAFKKDVITFFHAKDSRMPKAQDIHNDCYDTGYDAIRFIEYDTFDSYREKLTELLKKEKFDVICLAAAVSDYGVANFFNGKYHSSDDMEIKLVKLPKVITEVRALAPESVVCGFKLLVNSTDDELKAAMDKQFSDNGIDLCIGNDLRDIKNDNHRLTIKTCMSPSFEIFEKKALAEKKQKLEDVVVEHCLDVWAEKNKVWNK